MPAGSSAHAARDVPPRYPHWAATGITVALAAVYAILLLAPAVDGHASRVRLRDAANALGRAIADVEASYAVGDLSVTDPHLGLPQSAACCSQLRATLPASGRAVLSCVVRGEETRPTRVTWLREPLGAWRCEARSGDAQALPAACSTE